jgi:sphingosine kinase
MEGGSPLTLVEYHLENKNDDHSSATTIYSFLNFEWAMVSDVDFESEEYRRTLGSARFTFTALQRIAFLRVYRGKLSFIEVNALNDSTWTHLN